MHQRIEKDSLGEVYVPADKFYGAQTERAIHNFNIGSEVMPQEIIHACALIKKAAATINSKLQILDSQKAEHIKTATDEILAEKLSDNFPLKVWQTGSGTQTNMNVNEVIANRATQLAGGSLGDKTIHPNDHVNLSQSSNDVFPTAMHIATVKSINQNLLPALTTIQRILESKATRFSEIVKVGRTHLMEATPITFGQVFSTYAIQISKNVNHIKESSKELYELPIGGTAVGTGLNTKPEFAELITQKIAEYTFLPFYTINNKFQHIATHDVFARVHGSLKSLASSLMKIANDIRWMASGPNGGIGEITIPANEPGSSIMPGKVNPTQCEAMTQVCAQVMGNDTTINIATASGNFELNVFKPVIVYNTLQSIQLLANACKSFSERCVLGIEINQNKVDEYLSKNLMLVTCLTPVIGYDKCATIAKKAHTERLTLKEASLQLGYITEEEFNRYVKPEEMTKPNR